MVFCRKISKNFDPFPHFQASGQTFYALLQNYLAPDNLSNLSYLAGAKQLICRTPLLATSELGHIQVSWDMLLFFSNK